MAASQQHSTTGKQLAKTGKRKIGETALGWNPRHTLARPWKSETDRLVSEPPDINYRQILGWDQDVIDTILEDESLSSEERYSRYRYQDLNLECELMREYQDWTVGMKDAAVEGQDHERQMFFEGLEDAVREDWRHVYEDWDAAQYHTVRKTEAKGGKWGDVMVPFELEGPSPFRTTTISKRVVTPEALERRNGQYEERGDKLVVFRVLNGGDFEEYADVTQSIREERERKEKLVEAEEAGTKGRLSGARSITGPEGGSTEMTAATEDGMEGRNDAETEEQPFQAGSDMEELIGRSNGDDEVEAITQRHSPSFLSRRCCTIV